jgi:hypothetical protein
VLTEVPRLAVFLHLSALHADDWVAAIAGAVIVGSVSIPLRTFRLQPGRSSMIAALLSPEMVKEAQEIGGAERAPASRGNR